MTRQHHTPTPAPGALGLVQAFVNTRYGEGRYYHEELANTDSLRDWLTSRGLLGGDVSVSEGDLRRVWTVRAALRALLRGNSSPTAGADTSAGATTSMAAPTRPTTVEAGRPIVANSPHGLQLPATFAPDTAGSVVASSFESSHTRDADQAILDQVNAFAIHTSLTVRFHEGGRATLEPDIDGVEGAVARLLAGVIIAQADGTWRLLKVCRNAGCSRAFYDISKNHSGVWCAMGGCGNRVNARASRARRRSLRPT